MSHMMAGSIAALILLLASCGGPDESQANNAGANISKTASPPATAPEPNNES